MRSVVFSKIPFEYEKMPNSKELIEKNLFGNNIGNEYFFNAVVKSLHCEKHELFHYRDNMNLDEYNSGIFIQANQIRNGTASWIRSDLELIKSCNIPFVIVCVGSDSDANYKIELEQDVRNAVNACYNEILLRTASIGVRGEWTKKVLIEQCGIPGDRIDVIGCPSVRYFGIGLEKYPRNYHYSPGLKIAVNYTAYHYNEDEAIYLNKLLKKYDNSYIMFTDKIEADLLFNNKEVPMNRRHDLLPSTSDHFMMRQNRCRFMATQKEMMECMRTFDFSIGSRIHQAIIAILSGCPALLIAHSQRVLEIAEYHKIPYIYRKELIDRQPSVETLYYRACAGMINFYKNYDKGLKEYVAFLKKNNLVVASDFISDED